MHTFVYDVSPLRQLHSLWELNLTGTNVRKVDPLSGLNALRHLDLAKTPLGHLYGLHLPSLERLELRGSFIRDVAGLDGMPALKGLDLGHTQLDDLTPVQNCRQLAYLSCHWCTDVADLGPLEGLNSLIQIQFDGTAISSLAPLANVKDLRPLLSLPSLERVVVDGSHSGITPGYNELREKKVNVEIVSDRYKKRPKIGS